MISSCLRMPPVVSIRSISAAMPALDLRGGGIAATGFAADGRRCALAGAMDLVGHVPVGRGAGFPSLGAGGYAEVLAMGVPAVVNLKGCLLADQVNCCGQRYSGILWHCG